MDARENDKPRQALFNNQFPFLNLARFPYPRIWGSLKTRLVVQITATVLILMAVAGVVTYRISQNFISRALERSTRIQLMAMRHALETFLEDRKKDLRFIANQAFEPDDLENYLANLRAMNSIDYRGLFFIAETPQDSRMICTKHGITVTLPSTALEAIHPDPRVFGEALAPLAPGEFWISPILETELPCADDNGRGLPRVTDPLIYIGTPWRSGFLLLSFSAKALRNLLSVYNSPASPIHAFPRTPEPRYSFVFDPEGWLLFQSGDPEKPDEALATYLARDGYTGTLGRPGLPEAFRPAAKYGLFWKMASTVREGRSDAVRIEVDGFRPGGRESFLAYAPVRFNPGADKAAFVYAGVGYLDVSRLTIAAGYRHLDAMFLIILVTALVMIATIYILGHLLTRPLRLLTREVGQLDLRQSLKPIELAYRGDEFIALRDAINQMIATLNRQVEEIQQRDLTIHRVTQAKPVDLSRTLPPPDRAKALAVPGIIGTGMKFDRLRSDIHKAARVDADVLLEGETGTGKQLAAEAIHLLSRRAAKPFISINCGALDEHLLLDTLFGHVRGAFTEARSDRKGAFLQAENGTLFLDEIQAASAKVQQALLRAIAMRRIRPLGSDSELEVNVRLIAATNVDLRQLIGKHLFREDLYYRLKVLTLYTPPLRETRENIPMLANHFLQQNRELSRRGQLALSKGALEKLNTYHWPGNIRELQHCIMRAVVMSETDVIQADDILLEIQPGSRTPAKPSASRPGRQSDAEAAAAPPDAAAGGLPAGLNPRQQRAWPLLRAQGEISRRQYQDIFEAPVSTRTANYDLQDLVDRGLLRRKGRGRAVRYVPVRPAAASAPD
jgi:DNA-binding NtrC family response regulator